MKLQTSIPLRREGSINLRGIDGVDYVFKADEAGDVVCDIDHKPTIVHLLANRSEFFWPASEADYDEARAILDDAGEDDAPIGGHVGNDDDDDDDADDSLTLAPGADPLKEANTPPMAIPGRKKPGRKPKAAAAKE